MSVVALDEFTERTPLDRFLAEQSDLRPVERFSLALDERGAAATDRFHRSLVPVAPPGPGQQYGFSVDLDACTGCKACVTACHSLNGLDDDESWRTVGLLHHEASNPDGGFRSLQTVTTACHHCIDPACLRGCPVDAYEKHPVTGIVAHLDDQCIGCGYCTLTCPYEVPRFNASRGIVRKCDMCSDRLAGGEAPACVQACPTHAISISIVDTVAAGAAAMISRLVPGAPLSMHTRPTTVYRTKRPSVGSMQPVDRFALRPAQAHPPLAVMLVFTQLSVGTFLVDLALRWYAPPTLVTALRPYNAIAALAVGVVALAASVAHLGRPRYAYRAIIGIRHSWLSREIAAFTCFAGLAALYAVLLWLAPGQTPDWLGPIVAGAGAAGVGCSVMIYAVTGRQWWTLRFTLVKFTLTTLSCGVATVMFMSLAGAMSIGGAVASTSLVIVRPLTLVLVTVMTVKLLGEAALLRHVARPGASDLTRTARLLAGALARSTRWRFALGVIGGVVLPLGGLLFGVLAGPPGAAEWLAIYAVALPAIIGGELLERWQFFRAMSAPRMPGLVA